MYITGPWFSAQMFSNDIIILIICRISCHLDFYKNWRSRDFKWRKSEITVLVFIDTLKRVQSCQRKVRATLWLTGLPQTYSGHHLGCRQISTTVWSACCHSEGPGVVTHSVLRPGHSPGPHLTSAEPWAIAGYEPSCGRDTNSLSFSAITDGDCCANLNPLLRHYNFLAPSSVKWQRSLMAGFGMKHRLLTCSEWFRMNLCNCVNQEIVFEGILIVY